MFSTLTKLTSSNQRLLVESQQSRHKNNAQNMFEVNNKKI